MSAKLIIALIKAGVGFSVSAQAWPGIGCTAIRQVAEKRMWDRPSVSTPVRSGTDGQRELVLGARLHACG